MKHPHAPPAALWPVIIVATGLAIIGAGWAFNRLFEMVG